MEDKYFIQLITVIFLILIISIIYWIIAKFEARNSVKKIAESNIFLFWWAIVISICISFGIAIYIENNPELYDEHGPIKTPLYIALALPFKLIMAYLISQEAKKQNRNAWLWFFLSFIEFHSAMIALGFSKTIYKLSESNKTKVSELNTTLTSKIQSLKGLLKDELKSSIEVYTEIDKLKDNYQKQFSSIVEENATEQKIEKFKNALNSGAIAQEEYELKIQLLNEKEKI